jgi:hypothetical protein
MCLTEPLTSPTTVLLLAVSCISEENAAYADGFNLSKSSFVIQYSGELNCLSPASVSSSFAQSTMNEITPKSIVTLYSV